MRKIVILTALMFAFASISMAAPLNSKNVGQSSSLFTDSNTQGSGMQGSNVPSFLNKNTHGDFIMWTDDGLVSVEGSFNGSPFDGKVYSHFGGIKTFEGYMWGYHEWGYLMGFIWKVWYQFPKFIWGHYNWTSSTKGRWDFQDENGSYSEGWFEFLG